MKKIIILYFLTIGVIVSGQTNKSNHFHFASPKKDSVIYLKRFEDFYKILNKLDKEKKGYFLKAGCCMGGESWGKPSKYKISYIAHLGDSLGLKYMLTTKDKFDTTLF